MEYGILGFLIFVSGIYAIVNIFSSDETPGAKTLWILLVLVLPVIGFVIWFVTGPRSKAASV